MKRLLLTLTLTLLAFSAYAVTMISPGSLPTLLGQSSRTHYYFECYFQTTGDNIPIDIYATNFKSDSGTTKMGDFVIKHPGATSLIFEGHNNEPSFPAYFYVMNEDYNSTSEADKILLADCRLRTVPSK